MVGAMHKICSTVHFRLCLPLNLHEVHAALHHFIVAECSSQSGSNRLSPPRTSRWGTAAVTATGLPRPVRWTLPLVPCRSGDPGRWPIALQAEKRGIAEGQAYENHALTGRCGPVAVTAAVRIARVPEPVFESGCAALQ